MGTATVSLSGITGGIAWACQSAEHANVAIGHHIIVFSSGLLLAMVVFAIVGSCNKSDDGNFDNKSRFALATALSFSVGTLFTTVGASAVFNTTHATSYAAVGVGCAFILPVMAIVLAYAFCHK